MNLLYRELVTVRLVGGSFREVRNFRSNFIAKILRYFEIFE